MKKKYYITMCGESGGSAIRELTKAQYELIEDLFDELNSEYVGGYIEELPDIDKLFTEFLEFIKGKNQSKIWELTYEFIKTKDFSNKSQLLKDHIKCELESRFYDYKEQA